MIFLKRSTSNPIIWANNVIILVYIASDSDVFDTSIL
ncbi:hypothetical protein PSM36_0741 [Proteiniphilum saccharofermentans]|uniref:Uncharacterized protein n=1 Tax=Proteiniphilum saccharofermentans TaxID=1642647 RepID=A0A1R3T2W4_9BACT|nr:hypothetical protein PSM36_0741 [Proteiniphilum saccharofermentans]SEA39598.1 hypothetical protein SAMN05216331_1422 [Porphyromonadaceae bacterium KH3R12]